MSSAQATDCNFLHSQRSSTTGAAILAQVSTRMNNNMQYLTIPASTELSDSMHDYFIFIVKYVASYHE